MRGSSLARFDSALRRPIATPRRSQTSVSSSGLRDAAARRIRPAPCHTSPRSYPRRSANNHFLAPRGASRAPRVTFDRIWTARRNATAPVQAVRGPAVSRRRAVLLSASRRSIARTCCLRVPCRLVSSMSVEDVVFRHSSLDTKHMCGPVEKSCLKEFK